MSLNCTYLENLVVLVIYIGSERFGQMARVVNLDGKCEAEFVDGVRRVVSRDDFKMFARYPMPDEEIGRCLEKGKDIVALREDFCRLNGCGTDGFCRDYGKLFFS